MRVLSVPLYLASLLQLPNNNTPFGVDSAQYIFASYSGYPFLKDHDC